APAANGVEDLASARVPARRVRSARDYFETLPQRFVPAAATGIDAVFQWELGGEGGEVFHAEVRDGALRVAPGPHERPTVALVIGADDYVRVVNGELDGMRAFTTGKGRIQGSLAAAMKMRTLFPA
ncbi:MAG: SCP2 sterol-binding domain-containing protein, partial [Myxococcota bacterium]|nr:SCP2 sterol-binding domain-containing protein [Myxococcota bacterium]